MELDPKDVIDGAEKAVAPAEAPSGRLNAVVAVTVAILATFMGICKVKDDNIVQAMQQAQADKLWPLYWASLVPTLFGFMMGLAGLAGWRLHPEILVRLLS